MGKLGSELGNREWFRFGGRVKGGRGDRVRGGEKGEFRVGIIGMDKV